MYDFQDVLNDLITERGLSLRKLASESKVSAIQYSRYLKGYYPTIDVAVRIADYFNCTLDYLFGTSDKFEQANKNGYDLSGFITKYQKALEDNNFTHWKFSKAFSFSESSLRHWKYGETPSIPILLIIAKNLSISMDYLIGRKNTK